MIVRVQFVEVNDGHKKIIHSWCLFSLNQQSSLREIFNDIFDKKLSCGRDLELGSYLKDDVCVSTLVTSEKCPTELMPTPLRLCPSDIKEDSKGSVYIEFELKMAPSVNAVDVEVTNESAPKSPAVEPRDSITSALMNRYDHYVSAEEGIHGDKKQFHALTQLVKGMKCGVQGTAVDDFREFLKIFSSLLWAIGPLVNFPQKSRNS